MVAIQVDFCDRCQLPMHTRCVFPGHEGCVCTTDFLIVEDPSAQWAEGNGLDGLYGKETMQRALCIDFDGVLHAYTSGWKGHSVVADKPVAGAVEACYALVEAGWRLYVLTSRQELRPVVSWLHFYGFPPMLLTRVKPIAVAYIDDRAVRFDDNWPSIRKMFA